MGIYVGGLIHVLVLVHGFCFFKLFLWALKSSMMCRFFVHLQVLIGKTGKTSLKRRVSEFSVETVPRSTAQRALHMLKNFDLDSVEEASLGCAVFYTWVRLSNIIHCRFVGPPQVISSCVFV